jgi:TonB family protein
VQETAHADPPSAHAEPSGARADPPSAHGEQPGAATEVDAAAELLKNADERLLQDRLIEPANALAKQNFMTNLVPANQLTPLKTVQPVYPAKARDHGQEGWVDVEFTVSETGKVQDVAIRAASSPGVFDDAALKAVNQWRYRPLLRDAKPVPVRTQIRLRFTLSAS